MPGSLETKLKNFLNLYWLRPENGLITPFKSEAFADLKFESPSLDLSCGDGLFMAIHLGAVFDDNFDWKDVFRTHNYLLLLVDKNACKLLFI